MKSCRVVWGIPRLALTKPQYFNKTSFKSRSTSTILTSNKLGNKLTSTPWTRLEKSVLIEPLPLRHQTRKSGFFSKNVIPPSYYDLLKIKLLSQSDSPTIYYDILDLKPGATLQQIRSAYLRKKGHIGANPSKNKRLNELLRDIKEAYEVLSNLRTRKMYDRGIYTRGIRISSQHRAVKAEEAELIVARKVSQPHTIFDGSDKQPFIPGYQSNGVYNCCDWHKRYYQALLEQRPPPKIEGVMHIQDHEKFRFDYEEWRKRFYYFADNNARKHQPRMNIYKRFM